MPSKLGIVSGSATTVNDPGALLAMVRIAPVPTWPDVSVPVNVTVNVPLGHVTEVVVASQFSE